MSGTNKRISGTSGLTSSSQIVDVTSSAHVYHEEDTVSALPKLVYERIPMRTQQTLKHWILTIIGSPAWLLYESLHPPTQRCNYCQKLVNIENTICPYCYNALVIT